MSPARLRSIAIPAALLVGAVGLVTWLDPVSDPATREAERASDRASYAVGHSAGAELRDVLPVSAEHFRQGLLAGLEGGPDERRVMDRPELFERLRAVLERVADAELAEVAKRIDQDREH